MMLLRTTLHAAVLAVAFAATAQEKTAPIPPPRPGLVESPKGDGRQMTPLRRTTHEERFNAALRLAERRKALGAAASPRPSTRPPHAEPGQPPLPESAR
jgi:hypothetical protein